MNETLYLNCCDNLCIIRVEVEYNRSKKDEMKSHKKVKKQKNGCIAFDLVGENINKVIHYILTYEIE